MLYLDNLILVLVHLLLVLRPEVGIARMLEIHMPTVVKDVMEHQHGIAKDARDPSQGLARCWFGLFDAGVRRELLQVCCHGHNLT